MRRAFQSVFQRLDTLHLHYLDSLFTSQGGCNAAAELRSWRGSFKHRSRRTGARWISPLEILLSLSPSSSPTHFRALRGLLGVEMILTPFSRAYSGSSVNPIPRGSVRNTAAAEVAASVSGEEAARGRSNRKGREGLQLALKHSRSFITWLSLI